MGKLNDDDWQRESSNAGRGADGPETVDAAAVRLVSRARGLMIISALTTLVAIAAVVVVIGYRVYRAGAAHGSAKVETTVTLPKGARVTATAVTDDRLVLTIDLAGMTEIRIFDLRTLEEIGHIRVAAGP